MSTDTPASTANLRHEGANSGLHQVRIENALAAKPSSSVCILDGNILSELRNPQKDLKFFLDNMTSGDKPVRGVILLPAIAETNYSHKKSSPQLILDKCDDWVYEHFVWKGIPELAPFVTAKDLSLGRKGPVEGMMDVFYYYLSAYWLLCLGAEVASDFTDGEQKEEAVHTFFERLEETGLPGKGHLPAMIIATALAGNKSAISSINIEADSPKGLMNGAWDLTHWVTLISRSVNLAPYGVEPFLLTRDNSAATLFESFRIGKAGSVDFAYEGETPQLKAFIKEGIAKLSHKVIGPLFFKCPLFEAISEKWRCDKLSAVLSRFSECEDIVDNERIDDMVGYS